MNTTNFLFLVVVVNVVAGGSLPKSYTKQCYLENPAIQRFREYVKIDTSKQENLDVGVEFWRRQASLLGLEFSVLRPGAARKPVCVLEWRGQDIYLPAIMLNSHMDVVTAEEDLWTHPPFSAYLDDNGDIYGRGTQDDKDVAIQYIEAIRTLKANNVTLLRTLYVTVMPDEETGGANGMVEFINTAEFKAMNIGFALDEGIVSADDTLYATYQDKRPWQIKITVRGESGHSSSMPNSSAMEKLQQIIDKIDKYREEQKSLANSESPGDYDSVNINIVQGGIAVNIIPARMSLVVDVRLAVAKAIDDMQIMVNSWVQDAGNQTKVEYIRRVERSDATPVDYTNAYWRAMQEAATEMDLTIKPVVCPAASDMINLRNIGIPALGFAPKTYTNNRIHGIDEHLNAGTFLQGIEIYVNILKKLGNLSVA